MRILFVGAVDFSRHCLKEIIKDRGDVVAVITLNDKYASRHSDFADLRQVTLPQKIPIYAVRSINQPEVVNQIRELRPDVIFVFGWSQIISREVLEIPPLGCIGTHPALLPKNRGRHPLIWALVEGLEKSGLTFFYLDEGADSGDILLQKEFSISQDDTAATLFGKIKLIASECLPEVLQLLESGNAPRLPQDHSQASYWRKRSEKDGEIHWTETSRNIHNLVRALTRPYPGAHCFWGGRKVTVWKTALTGVQPSEEVLSTNPGAVVGATGGEYLIRTGDGLISVKELDLNGALGFNVGQVFDNLLNHQ